MRKPSSARVYIPLRYRTWEREVLAIGPREATSIELSTYYTGEQTALCQTQERSDRNKLGEVVDLRHL